MTNNNNKNNNKTLPPVLLFWMVLFTAFTSNSNLVVYARCSVSNEQGQSISLVQSKNNVLPSGVQYDDSTDRLDCSGSNSCEQWTITDCAQVNCFGSRACQATQLTSNANVQCRGYAACQDAQVKMSEDAQQSVVCTGGADSVHSCQGASLQTSGRVTCLGGNACVGGLSPPAQMDAAAMGQKLTGKDGAVAAAKTVLHLGASGVVHCTGGQGTRSCQNLVVHINHARRACFRDPYDDDSNDNRKQKMDRSSFLKTHPQEDVPAVQPPQREHCAVLCDNAETECDFKSMEFVVQ
ncbi:hypothetical protein ACA910_018574 [Epithemia clementina (nom. ined.)]